MSEEIETVARTDGPDQNVAMAAAPHDEAAAALEADVADLIARFPTAANSPPAKVAELVARARNALPVGRFRDMKEAAYGRMLFVMHNLERTPPAADPAVSARLAAGLRTKAAKMPHPWSGTKHGDLLRKSVRY